MIRKFIKYFSIIAAPMFILALLTSISLGEYPEKIYLNDTTTLSDVTLQNNSFINKLKMTSDNVKVNFLGIIPLKSIPVQKISELELYPGGSSVGVRLTTKGVLVVGFSEVNTNDGVQDSPAKLCGIELGDVILKVNNESIESSKDLIQKVKTTDNGVLKVDLIRENSKISKEIQLIKEGEEYKMGLWVRDSTAGIGTLTFYHKDTKTFGALGHPITDGDTNTTFTVKNGDLLKSSVLSVRRGEKGVPGELKGLFLNDKEALGSILKNTGSGIYGDASEHLINSNYNKPMPVAFRSEIKEGAAKIITTIDEEGPKEYAIEIVKLLAQDKPGPKSMVIRITDPVLLEKTGGIVQGMSGSPIIQDEKIVGAVTHVLINKPDYGYGIYIEWMLKDAGILQ